MASRLENTRCEQCSSGLESNDGERKFFQTSGRYWPILASKRLPLLMRPKSTTQSDLFCPPQADLSSGANHPTRLPSLKPGKNLPMAHQKHMRTATALKMADRKINLSLKQT